MRTTSDQSKVVIFVLYLIGCGYNCVRRHVSRVSHTRQQAVSVGSLLIMSGLPIRSCRRALAGTGLGGGADAGDGRARSALPTYADGTKPSSVKPGRTNRLDGLAANITLLPSQEYESLKANPP